MPNRLRLAIEQRKNFLITCLIEWGIYKKEDKQLYELTLSELEAEYQLNKSDH
ncbi:Fur-regulated basic protein A [Bacillus sp. OV194]|nr:Fur-regulated basic protein A [Bacillus sp. OV194]